MLKYFAVILENYVSLTALKKTRQIKEMWFCASPWTNLPKTRSLSYS